MRKLAAALTSLLALTMIGPARTVASPLSGAHTSYPMRPWPLSPHGPILPTNGQWFGAYVAVDPIWTGPTRQQAQTNFEAMVGRKMQLDREFYLWNDTWPTSDDYWSRDQGRILMFSWDPGNKDGTYASWPDIAAGVYDAMINAQAAALKAFGAPVFFIFHHEPNRQHPGENFGTPADFIAAWQHIHDLFVADGATNVSYMLTLMASAYKHNNADPYYPGSNYVDVLAADGYNWYGCSKPNGPWIEVTQIFKDFNTYALSKGKPAIVAEWGTGEDPATPGRKAQWFTDALPEFKAWTNIKGVSYFDSSPTPTCARWVNTSTSSTAAFTTIGADPWFNPWPMATISSGPTNPTTATTATFTFTSSKTGSTFTCSLDGGAATSCVSGQTYTGLAVGTHTFSLTPTDSTGDVGTVNNWTWTITT